MSNQSYAEKFQVRKSAASAQLAKNSKKSSTKESKVSDNIANGNVIQFISLDLIKDTSQSQNPSRGLQNNSHDYYVNQAYNDDDDDLHSKSDLSGSYDDEHANYSKPNSSNNYCVDNHIEHKSNEKYQNNSNVRTTNDTKTRVKESADSTNSPSRQNEIPHRKTGPPPLPVDKNKISSQSPLLPPPVHTMHDKNPYVEYSDDLDDSMNDEIERLEREIAMNARITPDNINRNQNVDQKVSDNSKTVSAGKDTVKPTKYKPYTLEQYKQIQPKEYVEIIPKLKPGM